MTSKRGKDDPSPLWSAFWLSLFGLVLQLFFLENMDLEPLFGPGGVKSISALAEDYPQRDWGTWLMHWFLPLADNRPDIAARMAVMMGSTMTIFGASLAGSSISDVWAGRWLGCFVACYAPIIWNSILIGPDAIATGVIWFGLGLSYYGASKHFAIGLPLSLFGAFACIFAAKIKITAFPATTFIGIVPFLAMKPTLWGKLRGIFLGSICLAGLLWLRENWMSSTTSPVSTPSLNRSTLEYGHQQLQKVFNQESVIVQLSMAALIGIFLPRRNILGKITLGGLCLVALLLTASTLGDKIRPRYFAATSLPILILFASFFSRSPFKWIRYIQNSVGTIVVLFLLLDSIAYHSEWAKLMHRYSKTELSTLPQVPSGWTDRYLKFSRLDHDDHSTAGAKRLHELSIEAKTEAVLGVPLRDGRDFHLKAAAEISDHKALILTPKFCCKQQSNLKLCAEQTLDLITKSSARLILPIVTTDHARIPNDTHSWYQSLLQASRKYSHFHEEEQWGYLDGKGNQKLPCDRPPRRKKGLWEIDGERHNPRPNNPNQFPKPKPQKKASQAPPEHP